MSTERATEPAVPAAPERFIEQGEQFTDVADVVDDELFEPLEVSDRVGGPLLLALVGGMALVLAVMTPVAGVKAGGLLVLVVAVVIGVRLLRGGGSR